MLTVNLPSSGDQPPTDNTNNTNNTTHNTTHNTNTQIHTHNNAAAIAAPETLDNSIEGEEAANNVVEELLTITSDESQAKCSNSSELVDMLGDAPLIGPEDPEPTNTSARADTAIINLEDSDADPSERLLESEYSAVNILEEKLSSGASSINSNTLLDTVPV